jgi:hypothetical protein
MLRHIVESPPKAERRFVQDMLFLPMNQAS